MLAVEAVFEPRHLCGRPGVAAEQSLRDALGIVGGRGLGKSENGIDAAAISTDNHWLTTEGGDNFTTQLWDLSAKNPMRRPVVLRSDQNAESDISVLFWGPLAISSDSHRLVTYGNENTA